MTTKELLQKGKTEFEGFFNFYMQDISSIRTGRASPSLVEDLQVDYFGVKYRLKELASLSTPEARSLVIQPWDKGALEAISGAISKSSIGLAPIAEGHAIRLNIPSLTEDRRKEFIKMLKGKTEESRIKIRQARDGIRDKIQKLEKAGEIREDDKFKGNEDLQKLVDEYNGKIEDLEKKKEQELLTS